ncbi:hypothetical protein LEP1GSC092_3942 [Leptospira interrogans serovar Pyrogenes str. R168]|nr:hypothetical protein LEP1GSC092_3942 [Leptospira interrogans serovar Pyrogenes str. R168]
MVSFSKNLWSSVKIKFLQKTAALYDKSNFKFYRDSFEINLSVINRLRTCPKTSKNFTHHSLEIFNKT